MVTMSVLNWLLLILIVVALAALLVLVLAALQPNEFRVARSARIKAPPERIFPLINDLHAFNTWNPFVLRDPAITGSYSGPPSGAGAAYAWQGPKAGQGRMTVASAMPPGRLDLTLEFLKPWRAINQAEFVLRPDGDATEVTWAMSGRKILMSKVMGLFINIDTMVGNSFAEGLANLAAMAEK